jgi:hypothetical protein
MSSGSGSGTREHLQMRMDANLRITGHELICFQELVKPSNNDEVKLSHIANELSLKVPSSVVFFEKVLNENSDYFKSVHPQIFQFGGVDVSINQIIGNFLLFWYVIRPFTSIAACEERFTFHSIQHAFFEFAAFVDSIRARLQIQNFSAYVLSVHQQNYQISIQQNKALYDSYAELKTNECAEATKLQQEAETKLLVLADKCKVLESEKEALIQCKKLVFIEDLKSQQLETSKVLREECETIKFQLKQEAEKFEQVKAKAAEAAKAAEQREIVIQLQISSIKFNRQEFAALKLKYKRMEDELCKCKLTEENSSALLKTKEALLKTKDEELAVTKDQLAAALKEKEEAAIKVKQEGLRKEETKKKAPPPLKENKDKILKLELAKAQKIISGLEEELITALSKPAESQSLKSKSKKEIVDGNVQDARILVDLFSTTLKSEKILQTLQNYVVSSMRDNKIDEFPAWLVVAQSVLRSICTEVGIAKCVLSGRFSSSKHDLPQREDVFMGLLCWKVESRFRALSWLRNQVIRGYSENGKMGNVLLQSFLNYIVENQKIGGKITLVSGKTSAELAMEMSALNVLKKESLMLLDKDSFVPLSGAVFIPIAPPSLSEGVFVAVRNFAYLNVCCFICLMEAEGDSIKKILLDIFFDLLQYDNTITLTLTTKTKNKTSLTPDRIMAAHDKIVSAFPSDNRFTPLLNQFKACADSFQDLYAKTFLFFDSHSTNEIDFFRQKRILTLHNHADSLLDSFWETQDLSRHSEKLRDEIPESLIGKIMAMEVLLNEENESVLIARKNLEVLLMSLAPPGCSDNDYKPKSTIDETNFFLHALSHLLINGELLIDLQNHSDKSTSEEIIGFLCNQAQGSELREFITAIQESIHSFKEVRKGKKVMVQGKSSLGKILQSLSKT